MATKRKKKTVKVEEPKPEVKEVKDETLDVKAEREEIYKSWKRLMTIANAQLTKAEQDISSVNASMLAQIVRVLSQSGKVISEYEEHLRKLQEEPEVDEHGEEVMTPEELEMVKVIEDFNTGGGIGEPSQPESSLMDTKSGFNFRRD